MSASKSVGNISSKITSRPQEYTFLLRLKAGCMQAERFSPVDVVGLEGGSQLCSGIRPGGGHTFLRQRMAALVRGRLWTSSPPEQGDAACKAVSLAASLANGTVVCLGVLVALALALCAVFLPKWHLAQMVCALSFPFVTHNVYDLQQAYIHVLPVHALAYTAPQTSLCRLACSE